MKPGRRWTIIPYGEVKTKNAAGTCQKKNKMGGDSTVYALLLATDPESVYAH